MLSPMLTYALTVRETWINRGYFNFWSKITHSKGLTCNSNKSPEYSSSDPLYPPIKTIPSTFGGVTMTAPLILNGKLGPEIFLRENLLKAGYHSGWPKNPFAERYRYSLIYSFYRWPLLKTVTICWNFRKTVNTCIYILNVKGPQNI